MTLRLPWTGQDVPTNRQVAHWLHSFVEDRARRQQAAPSPRELLPDPGHGAGRRCSYRLEALEIDLGLRFSGSRTLSELLRRLIRTYRSQGAPQSAPVSRPAQQAVPIPASASIPAKRLPRASSRVYPTDGRRVEIATEDVKAELAKLGYSHGPQTGSRYFREGKRIAREEGGRVIQVFETP